MFRMILLERRGASEQTVRISGFVAIDGVGLCGKTSQLNIFISIFVEIIYQSLFKELDL